MFLGAGARTAPARTRVPGTTAQVTVNDKIRGTTEQMQSRRPVWVTMITTNDGDSGVMAMVSNKDELNVELLDINNLGGFTGATTPV